MSDIQKYVAGGTVQAGAGIYLPRAADDQLLKLCRAGEVAYILSSRQMGKSSVMIRTAERLRQENTQSVILDLTGFGTDPTAEQWYSSIIFAIAEELSLIEEARVWWSQQGDISPARRFTSFLQDFILTFTKEPIVVFVDEIDTTLNLSFTDDFFAAIRFLHNLRATVPELRRLSFVLMGVASPGDLIKDPQRTPFNIGTRVELTDFTYEEALPLVQDLPLGSIEASLLLRWVLDWTGGHPYLTLRVFRALVDWPRGWSPDDEVIREIFFGEKGERDSNLEFVRNMLLLETPVRNVVLSVFRAICDGQGVLDDASSAVKSWLKLSGIVARRDGRLLVRNRIYESVFTSDWVSKAQKAIQAAVTDHALPGTPRHGIEERSPQRDVPKEDAPQQSIAIRLLAHSGNVRRSGQVDLAVQLCLESLLRYPTLEAIQQLRLNSPLLRRLIFEFQHDEAVTLVVFSPDGKLLATVSDQMLRLWDAQSGDLLKLFPHGDRIVALSFSHDSQLLGAGCRDGAAEIWGTKKLIRVTQLLHQDCISEIAFSPDNRTVATASWDNTARIWDIESGGEQRRLPHDDRVVSLCFTANSQRLATACWDRTARIWNAKTGHPIATLNHEGRVTAVTFSADGKWLATASEDRAARVWDTRDARESVRLNHLARVTAVVFNTHGSRLATCADDYATRLWDTRSGQCLTEVRHNGRVSMAKISPDGEWLATASEDRTARIWHVRTGEEMARLRHSGRVTALDFSPTGATLATVSEDRTARVWETNPGAGVAILIHPNRVRSLRFSNDGKQLATACDDGKARIWNLKSHTAVIAGDHHSQATDVDISVDGELLATAGDDAMARIWNIAEGREQLVAELPSQIYSLALSGDCQQLVVGLEDGTARVLNACSGEPLFSVSHAGRVWAVDTNPIGQTFATAGADGTVRVWDRSGGECWRKTLRGDVYAIAFSSDGTSLASAGADGGVRVWNTETGEQLADLAMPGAANSVALSLDGAQVAAASFREVFVGDTCSNSELTHFTHNDRVDAIALSPDGHVLAVAIGGIVRMLPWRQEELTSYARSHLGPLHADAYRVYLDREP